MNPIIYICIYIIGDDNFESSVVDTYGYIICISRRLNRRTSFSRGHRVLHRKLSAYNSMLAFYDQWNLNILKDQTFSHFLVTTFWIYFYFVTCAGDVTVICQKSTNQLLILKTKYHPKESNMSISRVVICSSGLYDAQTYDRIAYTYHRMDMPII